MKDAFLREKAYQEQMGISCKARIDGYTDFIFVNRFGNVQHRHTLRHTFTTRLCEAGVNMKVIQDLLGHADISTTMNIYADATEEYKKKEMETFRQFLNRTMEQDKPDERDF